MNKNKLAKIISYLFVPPVMNLLVFLAVAQTEKTHAEFVILNSLVFGLLLPIAVFVYLRKKSLVSNDDATIKEERTVPYIIGIFIVATALLLNYLRTGNSLSTAVWLSFLVTSVFVTLINKKWKISAHTTGVGIPLGAAIFIESDFAFLFLVILALVIWARLQLKVHTPAQVIAGAALGSVTPIIILALR